MEITRITETQSLIKRNLGEISFVSFWWVRVTDSKQGKTEVQFPG